MILSNFILLRYLKHLLHLLIAGNSDSNLEFRYDLIVAYNFFEMSTKSLTIFCKNSYPNHLLPRIANLINHSKIAT